MPLGSPAIPTLRTNKDGSTDPRSLQNALNAIGERLRQIEEALGAVPGGTNLLSVLSSQVDGFVVKSNNLLVTRKLVVGDGLTVDNPTAALGNPKIHAPMLEDVSALPDGFIVKTGTDAVTRELVAPSASGITITDGDGVGGDPHFHVP